MSGLRDTVGDAVRKLVIGRSQPDVGRYLGPGDAGLHGPDSVTWRVHADPSMLIGGLRALLLQTMHPLAMAGVADHSDYRSDPWGRLHRTADYVVATTSGTTKHANEAIERVKAVHQHIKGVAPDGRPYCATDPHLLRWVHLSEIDSFLRTYRRYGLGQLSTSDQDRYVEEMATIGERIGVEAPPVTVDELRNALIAYRPELHAGRQARDSVRFLLWPPVPLYIRGLYAVVAGAAVESLPGFVRAALRLPIVPVAGPATVRPTAKAVVSALGWALGTSPIVEAARERVTMARQ